MDNFNYREFIYGQSLFKDEDTKQTLNENAPGYDTRKFGEALPTLESVKAAYESKLLKEELKDVEDVLKKAGFRFDDGILGGVGSGGAGYYDTVNDEIYGYNQSGPWNEEEFNKFYDNFEFNSNLYDSEDLEDLEISQPQLEKGIYAVDDMGYVQIHDNGDVEIFATPQLASINPFNTSFLPAFEMDASGKAIPQFSKDEMRKMLKDDMMFIL